MPKLLSIILLLLSLSASIQAETLQFVIQTTDGKEAEVFVEGEHVGKTGELLTFGIDGYKRPLRLDLVLKRPGAVPTLHSLTVEDPHSVWKPEPLSLARPLRKIQLRTKAKAEHLFVENKKREKIPSGDNSVLLLEVGNMTPGEAFLPTPVVLWLESDGYLPTEVKLPPEIWYADLYPPEDEEPLELTPAAGIGSWWSRIGAGGKFGLIGVLFTVLGAAIVGYLRFHYLKKLEIAHQEVQSWLERLNTFVDGSRDLASPLNAETLAEMSLTQARRLTGSEWEHLSLVEPTLSYSTDSKELSLTEILKHLEQKPYPLRIQNLSESRFSKLCSDSQSVLALPLVFKDQYRGCLLVGSSNLNEFSQTDQDALEVLAFQLAGAVERIKLHKETVDAYDKLAESEAQLIQSAKMAAVGQLAAGVAHELNSPLSAITLGVEMAQKTLEKNPSRAQKRLQLAMSAAEKATQIVSQLLYYSRDARLEKKDFKVQTLLDDARTFLEFQLEQDGVKLVQEGSIERSIHANLNELNQVLTNLILNARDSILKCNASSEITLRLSEADDSFEICVEDHGGGIADEVRDKIFEPFFTTKNLGDGTGLGLSISRKIMERHGGELILASSSSPTRFVLRFPHDVFSSS